VLVTSLAHLRPGRRREKGRTDETEFVGEPVPLLAARLLAATSSAMRFMPRSVALDPSSRPRLATGPGSDPACARAKATLHN